MRKKRREREYNKVNEVKKKLLEGKMCECRCIQERKETDVEEKEGGGKK